MTKVRQFIVDVESVFGHMKRDFGVRRTHLRGQRAVENDTGLTLMAMNLTKLGKLIAQAGTDRKSVV